MVKHVQLFVVMKKKEMMGMKKEIMKTRIKLTS